MKRKIFYIFVITAMAILFAGFAQGYPLKAALNSVQVVPASFSTGRGSCKINTYESWFGPAFDLNCEFSGLIGALTDADVRTAPVGQNGNPYCMQKEVWASYPLPGNGTGRVTINCRMDWTGAFAPVDAKNFYVVLQTTDFPEGELRGQFKPVWLDGDVDGEGRTEISIFRPSDGYSYAYCSMNNTTIRQPLTDWNPLTDSEPFLADFDGDAIADWAFVRTVTHNGTPGMMFTAYRQSRNNEMAYVYWGRSTYGDIPAYGDYNGDGTIEVAVFRPAEGKFYIMGVGTERWGMAGDKPCPADYDGDGKTDLCVVRAENEQLVWYIRQSSDNQYRRTPWGLPTDEIYPGYSADFDGDGLNELLVSRIENNQRIFYALLSRNNSWFTLPWGLATDKVKIGDYNNDAISDIASIREENNQLVWYINQGTAGTSIVYWGLPGDK